VQVLICPVFSPVTGSARQENTQTAARSVTDRTAGQYRDRV